MNRFRSDQPIFIGTIGVTKWLYNEMVKYVISMKFSNKSINLFMNDSHHEFSWSL